MTDARNFVFFRIFFFSVTGFFLIGNDYSQILLNNPSLGAGYFWMEWHGWLKWLLVISFFMIAVGFAIRLNLLISLLGMLMYFHPVQMRFPSNDKNLLFMVCLTMLFFPQPQLSKEGALAPLKLIQLFLALAYFSSGLSKLVNGSFAWLDGITLRSHLAEVWIYSHSPVTEYVMNNILLCSLLSIAAVIFELTFILAVIHKRFTKPLLISGIIFHLTTWVLMGAGPNFLKFMVPAYAAFLPDLPAGVLKWWKKLSQHFTSANRLKNNFSPP